MVYITTKIVTIRNIYYVNQKNNAPVRTDAFVLSSVSQGIVRTLELRAEEVYLILGGAA